MAGTPVDSRGGVRLAVGTHVSSEALGKSLVVSDRPKVLLSAKALNSSGADAWLFILDATELPANGATPSRIPIPVPAGSVNGDVWQGGTVMANGVVLAMSSTLATLTLIAGDTAWFDAEVL